MAALTDRRFSKNAQLTVVHFSLTHSSFPPLLYIRRHATRSSLPVAAGNDADGGHCCRCNHAPASVRTQSRGQSRNAALIDATASMKHQLLSVVRSLLIVPCTCFATPPLPPFFFFFFWLLLLFACTALLPPPPPHCVVSVITKGRIVRCVKQW